MMSRLLGYLVTILMLAVVFDGLMRLTPFAPKENVVEFHPELGWAKKKGETIHRSTPEFKVDYAINSKGLRGPETPYEKPAGTKRILVVGDSFVQGYSVADQDLFLRVLERDLRARNERVEVLNGGTEGWSTDQQLAWLETEGLKYQPDIVVLAPYQNDVFWNAQDRYVDKPKPLYELQGDSVRRVNPVIDAPPEAPWFMTRTAIGNTITTFKRAGLQPTLSIDGKTLETENAVVLLEEPSVITIAWRTTGALLREFAKAVKGAGAEPVALLVPSSWEIHGDVPPGTLGKLEPGTLDFARPRQRFAELASAAGFHVVDPTPRLKERAAAGERLYFKRDWHWNVTGNHVVADVLREGLANAGLLAPGDAAHAATDTPYASAEAEAKGLPTWGYVVLGLWLLLSVFYWRSYPEENVVLAFLKVGLLIGFVTGVFLGIGALAGALPPALGGMVMKLLVVALLLFVLVKVAKRLGVIAELYGAFLRRGHWYMLPLLVVMIGIGMLLVVAASSPFVAPFIYTLF